MVFPPMYERHIETLLETQGFIWKRYKNATQIVWEQVSHQATPNINTIEYQDFCEKLRSLFKRTFTLLQKIVECVKLSPAAIKPSCDSDKCTRPPAVLLGLSDGSF